MTILAGKKFNNTEEAFQYFIDTIYPTLDSEDVKKVKQSVYLYKSKIRGLSEDKMLELLELYGKAQVKKNILISFN